jgi:hypothetical protein
LRVAVKKGSEVLERKRSEMTAIERIGVKVENKFTDGGGCSG